MKHQLTPVTLKGSISAFQVKDPYGVAVAQLPDAIAAEVPRGRLRYTADGCLSLTNLNGHPPRPVLHGEWLVIDQYGALHVVADDAFHKTYALPAQRGKDYLQ